MYPTVSIIIPNYNHAPFLKKRIDSILCQTYQNFELIILDDCSIDNSRDIIEKYRKNSKVSNIIFNDTNSGSPFKQWARGLQQAKGKYVWIAESDDKCEDNLLEELIKLHQNFDNVGIAYCKSLPINSSDQIYDYSDWWMKRVDSKRWESDYFNYGKNECEKYLSVQCTIPNASAVLFEKSVFDNFNLESIDYKVCGDWRIYVQILRSKNICYHSMPLNYHRNHDENARTKYSDIAIEEQFNVLRYIAENFSIEKTSAFNRCLEERISKLISLVKTGKISFRRFKSVLRDLYALDHLFAFRLLKIFLFKTFNLNTSFK